MHLAKAGSHGKPPVYGSETHDRTPQLLHVSCLFVLFYVHGSWSQRPAERHSLDGIPGAYERALLGREQATAGKTIPLDDL